MKKITNALLLLFILISIASAKESTVYHTPKGERYHLSTSCRSLARSKTIYRVNISEANDMGLTPCKICY